jgi:pimeloyl-ACP methyl ester carboxylesterase/quercetin dioxygenase-like cupin family protein
MTNPSSISAVQGFVSDFAEVNGVRLHYLVGGNPDGPPVLLWHGFLGTGRVWGKVMPALANAGLAVLVPDMRGYGDSDKPEGSAGHDARALADEFRGLAHTIGFGGGRPLVLVGFDMGAPPALLWAADHPDEVAGLVYIEEPVMLLEVLSGILAYTPETMKEGSMWWWILPLAPGVPERLVVGHERQFLTWFYDRAMVRRDELGQGDLDEILRTFAGREGVLGAMGVYRAAFTTMDQTQPLKASQGPGSRRGARRRPCPGCPRTPTGRAGGRTRERQHHSRLRPLHARRAPDEIVRHVLALTSSADPHRYHPTHKGPPMNAPAPSTAPIPADDPARTLTIARPESDQGLRHIAMVGDTYTILVSGEQTAGRYCLIDMLIPPGGGPAPHRHDFEEMFSIIEGEIEFTFRERKAVARAGDTVNVPANAPHFFTNATAETARLLCVCTPAGQEEFFAEVGIQVETRTTPAPRLDEAAQAAFQAKAEALAPKYRTELLRP